MPPKLPPSALRAARIRLLQAAGRLPLEPISGPGSLAGVARTMRATGETEALRRTGKLQAAFRTSTGEVFPTGSIHDLNAVPIHLHDDPGLTTGFVDESGRFMTRATAEGRAPAKMLGGGHSNLWLRARASALRRHKVPRAYETLVREAEQSGGFTYGVHSGARPKRGFAFSASPENEAIIEALTPEAVAAYVASHEAALAEPSAFLGAWRSPEGKWYLDVSRVLPEREAALAAAKAARQRAVFDLGAGEEIPVLP